jgi:hypothetical protein
MKDGTPTINWKSIGPRAPCCKCSGNMYLSFTPKRGDGKITEV